MSLIRPLLPVACCLVATLGCDRSCASSSPGAAPEGVLLGPRETVTFLTYNVLADDDHAGERTPALMKILEASGADVIALQEVAPWFLSALEEQAWVRAYDAAERDGAILVPGGQLILSKIPIKRSIGVTLPGSQRRTALVSELELNGKRMAVATTHMESRLEDGPTRAAQLDAIFPLLDGTADGVLLGDLNFGDGEQPETAHLDGRYTDLWRALHAKAPGFTWDTVSSAMARRGSFPEEASRRIDRVLVRSKRWRPRSMEIVGDRPIREGSDLFPSDHFGLVATMEKHR